MLHQTIMSNNRISNPFLIGKKMFVPEGLAKFLQDGLKQHFAEAIVEWVDCPDLMQEPFNLAASGLCGDAVLLKMSGMSQLFSRLRQSVSYDLKKILKYIYKNHNDMLVIGASIGLRLNHQFGKLIMNASVSQVTENLMVRNQSRLAFMDEATGRCVLESVINSDCYPHGNFFISERKPGKALKVQVKECIGLDGTFVMKNGSARHHVMPYLWNDQLTMAVNIHNWLHYCDLNVPLVAVGTLLSSSLYYKKFCQCYNLEDYGLTQSHFHAYSSNGAGGHFDIDLEPINTVEYLGYFYPARRFYHINPQFRYAELQDFTDIMSYWRQSDTV